MEQKTGRPSFYVRDIPVYGDLVLSPMDGYSDLPFRQICRELGSAMSYTEFVNADELVKRRMSEIITRKLAFLPDERPMTIQIYGHDEENLVRGAHIAAERGPDIIDINMGCYVRGISERGAGSGMLRFPGKIARLFARLTRELDLPLTAKIRLGWDENSRNYVTVARILEDNGASMIAVHGRTKAQAYRGVADWDAIAEVKAAVRIPVIANGDVTTVADIARIQAHAGCDAVMIGRGAIGNPWIFSRRDRAQVPADEQLALLRRHLQLNLDFYGKEKGLVLFRKHAAKYIQGLPGENLLRIPLLTSESLDDLYCRLAAVFEMSDLPAREDNQPEWETVLRPARRYATIH